MTTFPANKLVPAGGEIYCHIFENPHVGVRRDLYWSVTVQFQPIRYADEDWECSMTCEWITWPVRDWRNLSGQVLDVSYGDRGIESSFYMVEHDIGTSTRLHIGARRDAGFDLTMDMVVDFSGYTGDDSDPSMVVQAQTTARFMGLIVVPENLAPKLLSPAEIMGLAAQYIDPAAFTAPIKRGHAFVMEPVSALTI